MVRVENTEFFATTCFRTVCTARASFMQINVQQQLWQGRKLVFARKRTKKRQQIKSRRMYSNEVATSFTVSTI